MSYQVLARKWRPQNFAQLVGQDHVKAALTNALSQNRLHHAYLFTGTRGVGKTTIARIFAKSLNCEQGVTATPCGVCSACVEIDKGYFVDLLEIDAASRTKVEDTRDLLDNVQYAPSRGRYKVYLIDEVHMLSKHSFNALLKTLEEPPPHVKFLLATTDPQKLPITVLSRCLQFSLKALSQSQIKQHLSYILGQEQISAEDEALALLARAAKGSLRDSLSLTDQAIAQTNGHIEIGPVREMLGYLEQSWAELLLQDVLNRDLAKMQQHLYQLIAQHSQFQSVLDDMLSLLHLAALAQFQLSAAELALTESAFVRAVAKAQDPESIQLYYQLLLSGKRDLAYAPDPRTGLEMALLRAIAFVPGALPVPSQSGRTAALSAAGIPTTSTVPNVSTIAANPSTQPSGGGTTLAPATVAVLPVDEVPIAAVHPEQVTQPNAASPEPDTVSLASPLAAEPTATPSIDPLTASIMARRGMSATVLAAGAESLKKSESQPPAAAIVPAVTPTATPVAAPSPAVLPAARSALAVVMANQASTSMSAQAAVEPPSTAPADVPPWQQDDITTAPAQLSPRQVNVGSPTVPMTPVQPLATESTQQTWQDEDTFAHTSASMTEKVAAAQLLSPMGEDEELDPVADSAGGDWAWQQYQTHEDESGSHEQLASLPAADDQRQHVSDSHAQPIRHALLDSLQVVDPDNTDFAEELPSDQIQPTQIQQQLVFNGVIDAHNFAVRTASQVDSWAARIDQLAIGGLMRLFLLHASPQLDESVAPVRLHLRVSQSQQHLDSEKNRQTLQQVLSASYGIPLVLQVEFLPQVFDCPLAIQQQIDQARYDYVRQLMATDPLVMALQQQFSAEIMPDTLAVN